MKYCSPWMPQKTKLMEHWVSKAYIDEDQTNYGGMIAEVYKVTTGSVVYDIYNDKGQIICSGPRAVPGSGHYTFTIDEAKQLALEDLKRNGWRIIEGKYAVML